MRYLPTTMLCLSILTLISCKQKTESSIKATPAVANNAITEADKKMILNKEVSTWEFGKTKNLPAFRALLADDYIALVGNKKYNADEVMRTYQSNIVNAYRLYNINVHPVADNTVIVYYEVAQDIKDADGGRWAPHIGAASTYVKRNGQWLNVFYQESEIDD